MTTRFGSQENSASSIAKVKRVGDYYTEHPEAMQGQPKRAIADYVKQNGVLVPRIFESLSDARASGLPVIARSEHIQDYNGASGILESPLLTEEKFSGARNEEELKAKALAEPERGSTPLRQYCRLLHLDEDRFREEVSFSFWELLKGYDRKIVADSSIPNKYHIMTDGFNEDTKLLLNYTIVEKGKPTIQFIRKLTPELEEGIDTLIEFYETVRNLDRFDKNHCPIVEAQTLNGKNYFLQYHRVRDFEPVSFTLERNVIDGEIEVPFVRGATQTEGMTAKTTLAYSWWRKPRSGEIEIPKEEGGSFDIGFTTIVFSELMVRKRKLQVIPFDSSKELEQTLLEVVCGHLQSSKLFKPQISVVIDRDKLMHDKEEIKNALLKADETGEDQSINLHIVSDGRKAYLKRV